MLKFLVCSIGAVSLAVGALASAPVDKLADEAPATQGSSVALGETEIVCCVTDAGACHEVVGRVCPQGTAQVGCPCGPPVGSENE